MGSKHDDMNYVGLQWFGNVLVSYCFPPFFFFLGFLTSNITSSPLQKMVFGGIASAAGEPLYIFRAKPNCITMEGQIILIAQF